MKERVGRLRLGAGLAAVLICACGYRPAGAPPPPIATPVGDIIAPGVVHVAEDLGQDGGVDLIDITLPNPGVSIGIAARHVGWSGGVLAADARLPRDWVDDGALAAVNGGYFGRDIGDGRKEIVGLLARDGRVVHPAPPIAGRGAAGLAPARYVRSAFGLTAAGMPVIVWAATDPGRSGRLFTYSGPAIPPAVRQRFWRPSESIGCGPTLIQDCHAVVTDREERLASDEPRPRTFLAYDSPGAGRRHFVLGASSPMSYDDVARYLLSYYRRRYHTTVQAAMCLDGGSSTQLCYRRSGRTISPRDTGVTVPVCVVVVKRSVASP